MEDVFKKELLGRIPFIYGLSLFFFGTCITFQSNESEKNLKHFAILFLQVNYVLNIIPEPRLPAGLQNDGLLPPLPSPQAFKCPKHQIL